jgi:hypothetical protein
MSYIVALAIISPPFGFVLIFIDKNYFFLFSFHPGPRKKKKTYAVAVSQAASLFPARRVTAGSNDTK